tara:strand:- start:77 stop:403 length:327 start_codon:yes stop_codon:yes gene_type:complete
MNKFETVILFSPVLTTSDQKKQEDSFKNQLSKVNGTIISQENWGLKDLSYNIKNNKKALYIFYQIEMEGSKIQEIKKTLNQNEKIIRCLFVKVKNHEELPTKQGIKEK